MNTLLVPLVTGAEVTFWVVAPLTILGALGLVLSTRAVYAALSVAAAVTCPPNCQPLVVKSCNAFSFSKINTTLYVLAPRPNPAVPVIISMNTS